MGLQTKQEYKEFVCIRVKQEKNVMIPHEYKMIVLIFLHNMFKGVKVDLMEYFDPEENSFDLKDLCLTGVGEKNVLLTAEEKLFDYQRCCFYNKETQEYISPFFPELFRVKNFEDKLEQLFNKLKSGQTTNLNF